MVYFANQRSLFALTPLVSVSPSSMIKSLANINIITGSRDHLIIISPRPKLEDLRARACTERKRRMRSNRERGRCKECGGEGASAKLCKTDKDESVPPDLEEL